MAILIKDMEMPESCFLCRFCRRHEYGEYIGEDTAWECVASKKRITDGQDLIATFKHPDCPLVEVCTLVEVPDEQPERNAQERYEDLCEYFKDCSDKGMGILRDRKEFKAWLERLHWHVVRCDELGRELEKLQSAQTERSSEIQDILEYLDKVLHPVISPDHWNVYSELHDMISMLPSAQPEQQWIPCEKKLPEEEEYVLISKKPSPLSGKKWCVTIAGRFIDGRSRKVEWRDIGFGRIYDDDVLAWMPLPEPWKGDTQE